MPNKTRSFLLFIAVMACPGLSPAQGFFRQLAVVEDHYQLILSVQEELPVFQADSLQVFVGEYVEWPGKEKSAIIGSVTEEGQTLIFQPFFSFRPGLTYTAFLGHNVAHTFRIPRMGEIPELTDLFPSAEQVPANLLKIYLHFSVPMGEGHAYERLVLTNAAGDTIHQPFVPLQPELWSEDRRRLTLWLDPGRVKRGLLSHEAHGVVLEEGGNYTLTVLPDWKDVNGNQLGEAYVKKIRVGAADYEQPQADRWSLEAPRAGSVEPLVIRFGEAMDHALAQRLIRVLNDAEQPIAGKVRLTAGESEWHFTPDHPWPAGNYAIVIDTDLEDLAGNNLNRPFDRDLEKEDRQQMMEQDFIRLELEIIPSN